MEGLKRILEGHFAESYRMEIQTDGKGRNFYIFSATKAQPAKAPGAPRPAKERDGLGQPPAELGGSGEGKRLVL